MGLLLTLRATYAHPVLKPSMILIAPLALVAFGLMPAEPSPAEPVADGTQGSAAVLFPDCETVPISYSISVPPGYTYFNLSLAVLQPDGTTDGGDYLASSLGDSPSGTGGYDLCGNQLPGTYTVEASGEYDDSADVEHQFVLPNSTFTVRKAMSRTTAKSKRHGVQVKVADERPNGFFLTKYPTVLLQRHINGGWHKIPHTTTTIFDNGSVIPLSVSKNTKVRAVTLPDDNYSGSTSSPVTLYPISD